MENVCIFYIHLVCFMYGHLEYLDGAEAPDPNGPYGPAGPEWPRESEERMNTSVNVMITKCTYIIPRQLCPTYLSKIECFL
jgi:hypothetical protein